MVVTPFNNLTAASATNPTTGGTWSSVAGNPGGDPGAPITYNGTINFTGVAAGTYRYDYTVTCGGDTQTSRVSYVLGSANPPLNDLCSKAATSPAIYSSPYTYVWSAQNTAEECPQEAASLDPEAIPGSWQSGTYDGDLWFVFPGAAYAGKRFIYATVNSSSFPTSTRMEYPNIAIYSGPSCGSLTLDVANGPNTITDTFATTTIPLNDPDNFYIRVSSLQGNEGKFNLDIQVNDA